MKCIQFKAKTYHLKYVDGTSAGVRVPIKKRLKRKDCNLKPNDHAYYNSDMFEGMLNRYYRGIVGEYTDNLKIDALPEGTTVDQSGFLAVVTMVLPDNFR